MSAIIIATMVFAVVAEIATASRQVWSFARDNGFPYSKFLSKVRTDAVAFFVSESNGARPASASV